MGRQSFGDANRAGDEANQEFMAWMRDNGCIFHKAEVVSHVLFIYF